MYSRPQSRDFRVPHNYSGNIFNSRQAPSTLVEDLTNKRPQVQAPQLDSEESCPCEDRAVCEISEVPRSQESKSNSLLSSFGSLGSEELLLIALALIVFQGGKEPELALILLALLFIT